MGVHGSGLLSSEIDRTGVSAGVELHDLRHDTLTCRGLLKFRNLGISNFKCGFPKISEFQSYLSLNSSQSNTTIRRRLLPPGSAGCSHGFRVQNSTSRSRLLAYPNARVELGL